MLLEGQVENVIIIFDLHSLGIGDIPISFIQKIIGTFQNAFKAIMFKMFFVNATTFTYVTYKIVSLFLDESTNTKIQLFSKSAHKILLNFIDKKQLFKEYGGEAEHPNLFWYSNLGLLIFLPMNLEKIKKN